MARPPLALGTHGQITTTRRDGRWVSRCRFRDLDGVTRYVQRWGSTRTAAHRALQEALTERRGPRQESLKPTSRFSDAVTIWSAKIAERREDSTADTYRHWVDKVVLPRLGELRLHECDVPRLDAFFGQLARETAEATGEDGSTVEKPRYSANSRRTIRSVVTGVMQQAVLHGALATNPVPELERIESPKGAKKAPPRGLTVEERRQLLEFVDSDKTAQRADLPDLIRFALGSGLRIGELCAVRWIDLNLQGLPVVSDRDMHLVPVVAVRQNVYPTKGKGLAVHEGKTRQRPAHRPTPPVRHHTPTRTPTPRRQSRVAGIRGRRPRRNPHLPLALQRPPQRPHRPRQGRPRLDDLHTWRRTYATILDDEMSLTDRAKADLMGQVKFLKDTYVSRGE
jgi:integrase